MKKLNIKPHIVHIFGSLTMGGSEQSIFNLITHPILQHYRHSFICISSNQGEFREKFENAGISIHFCPVRWPVSTPIPSYRINRWLRHHLIFTFYWRFPFLLKQIKADLVHTHLTSHIVLQARSVIYWAKLPFIWTIRGMYRSYEGKDKEWKIVFNLIERNNRAVITAVSYAVLNNALGDMKLPECKVRVIYNGVNLSKFETKSDRGIVLRKRWGIPEDALVFGAAGRLSQEKRFDLLLEAAEKIVKRYSNIHVVIAGEGKMRQSLEEQIDRLSLRGRVHLVGYQSDMVQFWHEVDVAVISSDSEGLPNVLLEACASGVPCIATRVGGIPEVLGDGSGILVEPGSKEALAEAMEEMMDERVRFEYGRRAKEVAKKFSMDKTAEQYDKLYQELLKIQC